MSSVGVEVGAEVPEQRRDLIGPVEPQEAAVLLLFVILTLLRLVLRRPLRLERRQQEAQAAQEERQVIIHRLEVMLLGMRGLLGLLAQIVVVVVVHLRQALRVALAVLPVVAQRGILEGLLRRSGAAALETRLVLLAEMQSMVGLGVAVMDKPALQIQERVAHLYLLALEVEAVGRWIAGIPAHHRLGQQVELSIHMLLAVVELEVRCKVVLAQ